MNDESVQQRLQQARRLFHAAPADSLRLAEQALAELPEHAPAALRMQILRVRALALGYAGRAAEALHDLALAMALLPEGPSFDRLETLRSHAIVYEQIGAIDDCLDWALRADALAREIGDAAQRADTRLSVAVALSRSGQTEAGLEVYREVLALYQQQGDRFGAMQALNNIGIACKNLGRFEEAVRHVEQAIATARELGLDSMVAVALSNLGEPLWKLGRLAEAREVAADAARRLAQQGHVAGEIHARVLFGRLLAANGEAALAQAELEAALQLCGQTGNRNHAARAHLALSDLHKAAGRFDAALAHHEAYHAAERAQFNEDSAQKMRTLQVRYELERARHEADLHRLEAAEMAAQSRTDALTGLANRRHLDERLAVEFARSQRQPLAAALLDIDNFKQVNDRHGHAVGDEVLRRLATLLRRHCRGVDLVARYGGEEFCVLFVDAGREAAARACESVRQAVAAEPWADIAEGLVVTASVGVADRSEAETPAALLRAADHRLYAAKHGGKNRVIDS